MRGPKVAVIGAGSYFFGRPAIWNMVTSEVLKPGTLALVDTDENVLKTMMSIGEKAIAHSGAPTKLEGGTDRCEVLRDADFVVLTFSRRNAHYRKMDTEIAAKHGVRMCSSDTIGPGGVFRALREIPEALAVAKDMEDLCPDAWLINFINPTSVLGIALERYAKPRSFALCDGHHEPYCRLMWLRRLSILSEDDSSIPPEVERKLDLAIGGVNHNTWLVRFNYDGEDMMPKWRKLVAEEARDEKPVEKAKPRYNWHYADQLFDVYGAFPTAISHTKEYVPFFQGYGAAPNQPEPLRTFDADVRAEQMGEAWAENERYASGETPIEEFMKNGRGDHATDIIESMWGGLNKCFYINSPNRGAVTNMADDAFLELRSDVDMNGPRHQPFGEFPRGVLALQRQVLDTHELTAEAAVSCDKQVLLRALATDPLINNLEDARNVMNELLEKEVEHLPEQWRA